MTDSAPTLQGVHCAVSTPITPEGEPDVSRFVAHCRKLLEAGCHGLALLGTTGEANSFGLNQRMALLDAAIDQDVPAAVLLPGTSAPSVADAVALTAHAVRAGVKGVLVLPPYYYKGVDDEGLFRFYAQVIEGVGDDRLRMALYHIPQISQTPISHDLIERLLTAFPGVVCAIKDSSGDLDNMKAMAARFPAISVFSGADPLMLPLLEAGGAGCITGASNLGAKDLRAVWDHWRDPAQLEAVEAAQARVVAWRALSTRHAQLATIKAMLARAYDDEAWLRLKPPLIELTSAEREDVWAEMARMG